MKYHWICLNRTGHNSNKRVQSRWAVA